MAGVPAARTISARGRMRFMPCSPEPVLGATPATFTASSVPAPRAFEGQPINDLQPEGRRPVPPRVRPPSPLGAGRAPSIDDDEGVGPAVIDDVPPDGQEALQEGRDLLGPCVGEAEAGHAVGCAQPLLLLQTPPRGRLLAQAVHGGDPQDAVLLLAPETARPQ